jgi:hypothetical protein
LQGPVRRVERSTRRAPAPAPRRVAKPRPKSIEPVEPSATDNPDPWADDPGKNDTDKGPGGAP